jgi:hypothetical protein
MIDFRIDGNMKDSVDHEKSKADVCEARCARRAGVQENSLALIRPCEPIEG